MADHLSTLPLIKEMMRVLSARERFSILISYNELIFDMLETDKKLPEMTDNIYKEDALKEQEEAWQLAFSEDLVGQIIVES